MKTHKPCKPCVGATTDGSTGLHEWNESALV
eukprot:CAMPEP_0174334716 /NCGR_PEP_ID=MMETSP0810-20121108/20155_1 /TAXON_ID=73025 ORGANISM="Eutreptiella gymnastica-like, Strain CCMP1594" /NCGR_SAMPLE_ID=MMETSP0810 /ASSEMBLY_ACC=CAM_ASM_000659 /LENGTH=30 /DNA_ID= /DNA_START= /DNA_END= /DNA_ORIENTATION=